MSDSQEIIFKVKRIYAPPSPQDGVRILVDRLWPRGISKDQASIDEWMKEIAPSPDLRKWFGHRPERFAEFAKLYERELEEDPSHIPLVRRLLETAADRPVTLIYSAKDPIHNHAVVLQKWLNRQGG
ncbi:DUF488 domain-containing protein [Paenibacillus hamazuiensis]|uniref:DUF488 domain-containing protein n=1 Tax=Paenibacillus hamazuiensis TaxID=2936508 RepID=UPI00200DDE02|nr:DUF488 domain-containing protein [Paenibacillus hamazuiensis]